MEDPYLESINEFWAGIISLYQQFDDKRPVMLLNLEERRVYAYPYADYKQDLSENSQAILESQYTTALKKGMMVVFVKDNKKRKLLSYLLNCP